MADDTILTAARLREIINYDPDTGDFKRLKRTRGARDCPLTLHNEKGYQRFVIWIGRRSYRAHRLAWLYVTGEWPAAEIDHIDGNGLNNRFANLRLATRLENARNRKISALSTSGVHGVTWDKNARKWRARIGSGKNKTHLGLFTTKEAAEEMRRDAEFLVYGDFQPKR